MINFVVKGMCAMKGMNVVQKGFAVPVAHICLVKEIHAMKGTTMMKPRRNVIDMGI
jgi:hypothetical protein